MMQEKKELRRLKLIRNHLKSQVDPKSHIDNTLNPSGSLDEFRKKATFNKKELENLYFPAHQEIRDMVYRIIGNNKVFKHYTQEELTRPESRELLFNQTITLISELEKEITFKEVRESMPKFLAFIDACNTFTQGLSVFLGVNAVLYYTSLKLLSTSKHQKYIDRLLKFQDFGCFGLTEFGHGSNVKNLQTIATYDCDTKEYILHSKDVNSYKWWIGGAGKTANMAVIFAQLYIKDVYYGVQSFLVPIRDQKTHLPFPGVTLGDCGGKIGLQNLDNGFIGFRRYRINKDSLLDRFSQVKDDGTFVSKFKSNDERFAVAIGALEEGRMSLVAGSQCLLRNALAIAGRYAAKRKQFGKSDTQEDVIFTYQTSQTRLMIPLAEHFAFRFSTVDLAIRWQDVQEHLHDPKNPAVAEIHALISTFKPLSTNQVQKRIQPLRELMGGHGYSVWGGIGDLRVNNDINCTWEGDNTVLVQQTAKFLLTSFQKKMKGTLYPFKSLKFMDKMGEEDDKPKFKEAKDLHNYKTLKRLFEYRTCQLLQKCIGKLAERVNEKKEMPTEAWNNTQGFLIQNLTKAYGELHALRVFNKMIKVLTDKKTFEMLYKFMVLFALSSLEQDLPILLENGFLAGESVDLIKNQILELTSILSDEFITIMDVITPPDNVLQSPLGSTKDNSFEDYFNHVLASKDCHERPSYWEKINKKNK